MHKLAPCSLLACGSRGLFRIIIKTIFYSVDFSPQNTAVFAVCLLGVNYCSKLGIKCAEYRENALYLP